MFSMSVLVLALSLNVNTSLNIFSYFKVYNMLNVFSMSVFTNSLVVNPDEQDYRVALMTMQGCLMFNFQANLTFSFLTLSLE